MIPGPWIALLLVLATFRLTRLVSYDTFPPAVWLRDQITGRELVAVGSSNDLMGLTPSGHDRQIVYRRPLLAEMLGCVWCVGFWIALAVYGCWLAAGHPGDTGASSWLIYCAAPLAINSAAALVARWLDP
jgi:hypothetical protein